jgi:integrase/recombinase XerD
MPNWVKVAIDAWTSVATLADGRIFRPVNRADRPSGRRTCAKLCRAGGGELDQIQLLLGDASVQTTERYLGTKQDLVHAPNDAIELRVAV